MMVNKRFMKRLLPALLIFLMVFATVGGTLAYLAATSDAVVNTFQPGNADVEIVEEFDGVEKTDVTVSNTGNVPVYARVKLIFGWQDANGNTVGKNPWIPTEAIPSDKNWVLGDDGYYYYKKPIPVGEKADNLIDSITLKDVDGLKQVLSIMATCVQAEGKTESGLTPVQDLWGADVAKLLDLPVEQ